MSFEARLAEAAQAIGTHLAHAIQALPQSEICTAMAYAASGGKRLRGFLVLEGAALYGVPTADALTAASAIEAMHAYSLVHDDLPAMDDDALRRGQPTVHVKWDDATAILVGDALQTLAFELLARPDAHPDPAVRASLVLQLATASGAAGMVLGQAQDIAAETGPALSLKEITRLQANKTGALIEWAAEAGAYLGGGDPAPLRSYARAIGLAFQIADDILDVEGDAALAGKALRKDGDAGKATFVSLLGLDDAKARAADLVDEAQAALETFGPRADTLRSLARFVVARDR